MILYTYKSAPSFDGTIPPLGEQRYVRVSRFFINFAKTGPFGRWAKWLVERYALPRFRPCYESRNQALTAPEACLVSRNQAMHVSIDALKNNLKNGTDILQEYFVPRDRFVDFVDGMRRVLEKSKATLLNASVRIVPRQEIALNYAKTDVFAVVLYLNQKVTPQGSRDMVEITKKLIDVAESLGGTFYLPYQLHYTREQLVRAYPELDHFLALKRKFDPSLVFANKLYDKYGTR